MKGDKLFTEHYEPRLLEQGIENVVLRQYTHVQGFATDDPDNSTQLIFTPRREVDARLEALSLLYGNEFGVSITSLVSHKTEQKWLFLLDCSLSVSRKHERELLDALCTALQALPALKGGMLLRTVNSYHVVGFVPLSKDEWQRHMAQAILLRTATGKSIADVRYIAHCLERSYGSLRLTDYQEKPTPDFVCDI